MASQRRIDPIARLMQEHDRALGELSALSRAVKTIAERGFTRETYAKVERALRYIDDEVTVHNASEEEALFPILERYVEGPTGLMRQEHRLMRAAFRKLRKAALSVARHPNDPAAAADLAVFARELVHLMVNHIHKENHILFPLVQKFLTKDALREVAQRMV